MNPPPTSAGRPLVGLSAPLDPVQRRVFLPRPYLEAVLQAGGIPLLLPSTGNARSTAFQLKKLDALILVDGPDLSPILHDQPPHPLAGAFCVYEQDVAELALTREAFRLKLPVFGIGRGLQLMNLAGGGTLHYDLSRAVSNPIQHRQTNEIEAAFPSHPVHVAAGSRLAAMVDREPMMTNSLHLGAVARVAPGFRMAATAPDGVIEAMEAQEPGWFALGVQWRPELLAPHFAEHAALFQALTEAALARKVGRKAA